MFILLVLPPDYLARTGLSHMFVLLSNSVVGSSLLEQDICAVSQQSVIVASKCLLRQVFLETWIFASLHTAMTMCSADTARLNPPSVL